MECLALTVEEVMHIRQVLVKAELEKFQQYRDIYNALKKGKVSHKLMVLSSRRVHRDFCFVLWFVQHNSGQEHIEIPILVFP